eukprot:3368608-Prymnesium_polylepis.2
MEHAHDGDDEHADGREIEIVDAVHARARGADGRQLARGGGSGQSIASQAATAARQRRRCARAHPAQKARKPTKK